MSTFKYPPSGGGAGTLTSVGLADGSTLPIYTISGSPVTTAGTLTFTLSTKAANLVFAGPSTGSASQPTFRSLVVADLPSGTGTVTSVSVVSANGLAGTVATASTTPAITLSTSITGILQGNGTAISAATTTGTGSVVLATSPVLTTPNIGTATGSASLNVLTSALGNLTDAGTDGIIVTGGTGAVVGTVSLAQHVADATHSGYLSSSDWSTFNAKGTGSITAVSVASANGFAGSSSGGATPALTISTSINAPVLAGNGTAIAGATTTGSGSTVVLATSPTLVTPVLGIPTSGTLTSCTGLPLTTGVTGILPIANGGTNSASVVSAPAATAWAGWDANKNLSANNSIEGFRTQATANSTLTLVVGDAFQQYFTGSTSGQIVQLPTTSIVAGQSYLIVNLSTQTVTVNSSGANTIQAMAANTQILVTALVATPTTAANWNGAYQTTTITAPVNPTIQKFTSGTGTYTTPTGVQYIRVVMVGGGGGGAGSGTAGGSAAGNGTASTFGTSLLSAGGGTGGVWNTPAANGGTSSLGSGPIGNPLTGGMGGGASLAVAASTAQSGGGAGGDAPLFGGGGKYGHYSGAGAPGLANTGGGGQGGPNSGAGVNNLAGQGGGSGGFIDAIITSPLSTYTYVVGAAGSAGGAGTAGTAGGAGGSGYVIVYEYYANLAVGTTTSVSANNVFAGPSSGAAANPTFRSLVAADLPTFNSQVLCDTPNGFGSTNTKIRKWTNATTTGTDITYASSATLGDTFTINTAGLYSVSYTDYGGTGTQMGISKNSNQLTTNILSITTANRVINCLTASGGNPINCGAVVRCALNDVIRCHTDGALTDADSSGQFIIIRIG